MRTSLAALIMAGATMLVPMPASAATAAQDGLLLLRQLNVIATGNMSSASQHVQGKVWVGGNLAGSVEVAQGGGSYAPSSYSELTVGGNAEGWKVDGTQTAGGASVRIGGNSTGQAGMNVDGAVSVGGSMNLQGFNPSSTKTVAQNVAGLGGSIAQTNATFVSDLSALSTALKGLSGTAISSLNTTLSFSGTYGVFSMTADQFTASNVDFTKLFSGVSAGQSVIINVLGGGVLTESSSSNLNAFAAQSNVIWNFADATDVTVGNWYGSILAPNATVSQSSGNITGTVAADVFRQTGEVHLSTYGGTDTFLTPPTGAVPEPASWAMMIAGFGATGAALRRQRRKALLAA